MKRILCIAVLVLFLAGCNGQARRFEMNNTIIVEVVRRENNTPFCDDSIITKVPTDRYLVSKEVEGITYWCLDSQRFTRFPVEISPYCYAKAKIGKRYESEVYPQGVMNCFYG